MLVGPVIGLFQFYFADGKRIARGDTLVAHAYLSHLLGLAIVFFWLANYASISAGLYILAAYIGMSILKIRTFLEHQADESAPARTAIVDDRGPLACYFCTTTCTACTICTPGCPGTVCHQYLTSIVPTYWPGTIIITMPLTMRYSGATFGIVKTVLRILCGLCTIGLCQLKRLETTPVQTIDFMIITLLECNRVAQP